MAQIKAAEADRFVESPPDRYFLFLVYGPDAGLVSERTDRIAAKSGVDPADTFSYVRMDADEAAATGRLVEEADSISMFGNGRLIRVSGQTRKNLAGAVKIVLDRIPVDCRIIIEAGDLKRDAPLRRLVEKAAGAVAIPCYGDGPRDLDRLIGAVLADSGLSIDPPTRLLLASYLGADRRASRSEIEKLALYCRDRKEVTADDVLAIVGDSSGLAVAELVDKAMLGEAAAMTRLFARLMEAGEAADIVMLAALRLFQSLQIVRHQMAVSGKTIAAIIAELRPPVHFRRRDAIIAAMEGWPADEIANAVARLEEAAFECRRDPALGPSISERTLLSLALRARRSGARHSAGA